MSATIFTAEEAKKLELKLMNGIRAKGCQAVHYAVVALRANRRRGTASTKTKAEVNLSGAKPASKARARAGQCDRLGGGGVGFGPHPRLLEEDPEEVSGTGISEGL